MKTGKPTKRRLIILIAVIVAIAVALSSALIRGTAAGKNVTQSLLAPFESALSALTRTAERFYNYVFRYESLEAENEYLKARVASMEDEIRSIDTLQRENERLRAVANLLKEHEDYKLSSAYIVSWDASNWKSTGFRRVSPGPGPCGCYRDDDVHAGRCALYARGHRQLPAKCAAGASDRGYAEGAEFPCAAGPRRQALGGGPVPDADAAAAGV